MDEQAPEPGGFLPPSLPSPAPSNASTSSNLPHPRSHPLRAGSAKEDAARRYVEGRLLHISRRYTKKFQPIEESRLEDVKGYENMGQVAKDFGEIIDVVWLSGTPSLQIPYLLNIAGSVNTYLPAFPPSPKSTFGLLRKLDHAFSSLLKGEDSSTGEILPGFERGMRGGMSKTDMVRCKGLVEATRVLAVDVMSGQPELYEDLEESGTETDLEEDTGMGIDEQSFEMDVARVYEQTIVQLGERLDGSGVFGVLEYLNFLEQRVYSAILDAILEDSLRVGDGILYDPSMRLESDGKELKVFGSWLPREGISSRDIYGGWPNYPFTSIQRRFAYIKNFHTNKSYCFQHHHHRTDTVIGVFTASPASICSSRRELWRRQHLDARVGFWTTMPTYHIYDTTVKLYAWDPHQPPRCVIEKLTHNSTVFPVDPAYGQEVEALKEECFDGKEGVDFLGADMPFFVCHSGRDLFYKVRSTYIDAAKPSVHQGGPEPVTDKQKSRKDWPPGGNPYEEDEGDSTLSSISPSMFGQSRPLSTAARTPNLRTGGKGDERHQKSQSIPCSVVPKPIATATPIMIRVELSKKSFMKSINTNNDQDICISIFCNGEFTCSRVVRTRTAISYPNERMVQYFGGRRVDTNLEVPWVILPLVPDGSSVLSNTQESSSFAEKWSKINKLLGEEADLWGRTGKDDMFRTPVGEYLEELSKRRVPESMRNHGTIGSKAGIIDVVVSVGQSIITSTWSNLTMPQRKLPEQVCGKNQKCFKVPEELKPQRKAQIMAGFEREEATRESNFIKKQPSRPRSSMHEHHSKSNITIKMNLDGMRDRVTSPSSLPGVDPASQDEPSSSQPLALVNQSAKLQLQGSVPPLHPSMPQQSSTTKGFGPPINNSRGQTPVDAHREYTPSSKGPPDDPWEFLPFDAQKSPARSTRSQRSKTISASSADNILGPGLVDSYLTLRNRKVEALPSNPLGYSSQLKPFDKVRALSTKTSTQKESDSRPSRPSIRSDIQSSTLSKHNVEQEVSEVAGLGLDGAGNARKRKADTSLASAFAEYKRKRAALGSVYIEDGESIPNESQADANGTVIFKRDRVNHSAPDPGECPRNLLNMEEPSHAKSRELGYRVNKKQRNPIDAMTRELSSLLTPHKPAMAIDSSFGATFAEESSTRPTRNQPTRQGKVAIEAKIDTSQPEPPHVTATYRRPILNIQGVAGSALESMIHPLNIDDDRRAVSANAKGRISKINSPKHRVYKISKEAQDKSKASLTLMETAMNNAKTPGLKSSQPGGKGRGNLSNDHKNADNTTPRSSVSMKPVDYMEGIAGLDSRSALLAHSEMKTPTQKSTTTTTLESIETANTFTHATSSISTMTKNPRTAGTTSRVAPDSRMHHSTSHLMTASTTEHVGNSDARVVKSRLESPSELADLAWKPNVNFADSVLSYATENVVEAWVGNEYSSQSGSAYRGTKQEREAVFRASGILMGVRFVLGGGNQNEVRGKVKE